MLRVLPENTRAFFKVKISMVDSLSLIEPKLFEALAEMMAADYLSFLSRK